MPLEPWLASLVLGFLGLMIGSFLNVVIHRLPKMMEQNWRHECQTLLELPVSAPPARFDLLWPNSHCPHCQTEIRPWHNIPLLSYLWLRGRCAHGAGLGERAGGGEGAEHAPPELGGAVDGVVEEVPEEARVGLAGVAHAALRRHQADEDEVVIGVDEEHVAPGAEEGEGAGLHHAAQRMAAQHRVDVEFVIGEGEGRARRHDRRSISPADRVRSLRGTTS